MQTNYLLRHKDLDVVSFSMYEDGDIYRLDIMNEAHMPILGTHKKNLAIWIQERAISEERIDLDEILQKARCQTALEYLIQNLALSLSDTYWICTEEEQALTWKEVNLYQHPAELVMSEARTARRILRSNAALGGSLMKCNAYQNGHWYMKKYGAAGIQDGLQNVNEAFASFLYHRQEFQEYIPYGLDFDKTSVCRACVCPYFTDEKHELISAYNVTGGATGKSQGDAEAYHEYLDICVANGLERNYVTHFMDYMLMTDFLLTNTDRHWENFGILRDPDTLRFLSLTPIFDSGTAMLCDQPYAKDRQNLLRIPVHEICRTQKENLELVHDRNIVDIAKLPKKQEVMQFYLARGIRREIAEQIAFGFETKCEMLQEFQRNAMIGIGEE